MVGAVTWKKWFKKESGRVGPSKNWLEQNVLLERGDKPEMEGGATFFTTLQFSSVTFTLCGGKQGISLLLFGSSVSWVSYVRFLSMFSFKSCTKTRYHLCISDPFR